MVTVPLAVRISAALEAWAPCGMLRLSPKHTWLGIQRRKRDNP
jgi:hypothetical protein